MSNKCFEMLETLADEKYKNFHQKLIPNVDKNRVLGVRTPKLRALAKKIKNTDLAKDFLASLPHKYYEENNLHAFLIEQIKDFDLCIKETEKFLPFIDNWATCDSFRPKIFSKHKEEIEKKALEWIKSEHAYTKRYGIEVLLTHFLDEDFKVKHLETVAKIRSNEYYVKMMVAWYFATALTKQYKDTLPFIENKTLDAWTHNKAIQKARESLRIKKDEKEYLKTLKI